MIPKIDKSMCGCSLYTGCLTMGWLGVVTSFFTVLVLTFASRGIFTFKASPTGVDLTDEEMQYRIITVRIIYATAVSVSAMYFIVQTFYLVGVYKRNVCYMMPSLILSAIGVILMALLNFLLLFLSFFSIIYFIKLIFHIIQTAFAAYLWVVMYSYVIEVKEDSKAKEEDAQTKI